MRNFIAFFGFMLVLFSSTVSNADEISSFHDAIEKVNQPYKSALFYLRTDNAGVAGLELSLAEAAWKGVVQQYGKKPPKPLADDASWPQTVQEVSKAIDSGVKLAAKGESKPARTALLPVREHLYQMRKRNGLRVMADCVYDLNAAMDVLFYWRRNLADFTDPSVQRKAKAASHHYINQLKLCRSEAPEKLEADPDFKSVMDGAAKSAASLLKPIEEKRPDSFINVLRELKSFDVIIFVRWG
ncbi:MAG: hypothetical protein HKN05_08350 [Rhizobiales bacterium]|nr:hypothetical protein [Hyphomicrobiales bacterium]